MTLKEAAKALNRWSRQQGYADFDTYVEAGGGIFMARRRMIEEMQTLHQMIEYLSDTDFARREASAEDEPTDAANAHIQGAEEP